MGSSCVHLIENAAVMSLEFLSLLTSSEDAH